MKSGFPRKAPVVTKPSKKKPMFMKESDSKLQRKSPMLPMKIKRLSQ